MWNWLNCYLSGRHEFGISCSDGAIFLRCTYCGRRTPGWAVNKKTDQPSAPQRVVTAVPIAIPSQVAPAANGRIAIDRTAAP